MFSPDFLRRKALSLPSKSKPQPASFNKVHPNSTYPLHSISSDLHPLNWPQDRSHLNNPCHRPDAELLARKNKTFVLALLLSRIAASHLQHSFCLFHTYLKPRCFFLLSTFSDKPVICLHNRRRPVHNSRRKSPARIVGIVAQVRRRRNLTHSNWRIRRDDV